MGIIMNEITKRDEIEKQQQDFQNATITVTKNAVKRLKAVMASDGKDKYFLRMSVDGGGCQGFSYKFTFLIKTRVDKIPFVVFVIIYTMPFIPFY